MRNRKYTFEWWLLGLAVFSLSSSLIADLNFLGFNWFARSGSIVVLFAAIVEFKISAHIYEDIQRAQLQQKIIKIAIPFVAKPTKNRKFISRAAHILLAIGTIVWGYGDLLIP